MRELYLMKGSPAAGKSSLISANGLEPYTLCADKIRLMLQSPMTTPDGKLAISQRNDGRVWSFLKSVLESRMERGETTIIDACHSKPSAINTYRKLAKKYRYRVYTVDLTNVSIETVLSRNANRDEHKFVPEEVVSRMYARFETFNNPGWVTNLTPEEFIEKLSSGLPAFDFNKHERIYHIGDIHGCFEPLQEFINTRGIERDAFYIFTGDMLDRGTYNLEVLRTMCELVKLPNVYIIEGNHEQYIRAWASKEPYKLDGSKSGARLNYMFKSGLLAEIVDETVRQRDWDSDDVWQVVLNKKLKGRIAEYIDQVFRKPARELTRKLGQFAWYKFDGKQVLVTHGGMPIIPDPFTATFEMISGVGKYEDIDVLYERWNSTAGDNLFQIHGHRNPFGASIRIGNCFNLDGHPDKCGELRIVALSKDGFEEIAFNNTTCRKDQLPKPKPQETASSAVQTLRANNFVREKAQFGNVSSFNFTNKAFYKKHWEGNTTKARGLFINVANGAIVARSYDKFFNVGERRETQLGSLYGTLTYPLDVYAKENGFLGICGYDHESDTPIFASKSTIHGPFAEWFREILGEKLRGSIADYCKETGNSLIFEAIDPVNDPHVIRYNKRHVVLLDVVNNTTGEFCGYQNVLALSIVLGVRCKLRAQIIGTWDDFRELVDANDEYRDGDIEGYVVEDARGFRIKLKTQFYRTWKCLRSVKQQIERGRPVKQGMLYTALHNNAYAFMLNIGREDLKQYSIIDIRNMYKGAL